MHKLNGTVFAASCGLLLISGCAMLRPGDSPSQPAIAPVSSVTHGMAGGDASYQLGRSHQDRMQYEAAIAAYRKSLDENPANAEAHNALGVIYASLGRHEQALRELRAALALTPYAAHIHNNLGYAYLLAGRSAEAADALKVANRLDPANERVQQNMKSAENRLGATPNAPSAAVTRAPETDVSPLLAEKSADPSLPRLVSVAPNIYELRQATALQAKPPAAPVIQVPDRAVKLEIANGSGATGLAKRTSSSLQAKGYAAARLTNQIPYVQTVTEIQFRPDAEHQARRLNALFAVPARLVPSRRLSTAVDIRLVLGRDQGQQLVFNEAGGNPVAPAPLLASAGQPAT